MKTFLLLCLLACGLRAAGQVSPLPAIPLDSATQKVLYEGVVQVPNVGADELYSRAREWFALHFISGKSVLDMDDRASGKLIGSAFSTFPYAVILTPYTYEIWRTLKVYVRDGRFRYEVTDILLAGPREMSGPLFSEKKPVERMLDEKSKRNPYCWDKHGQPKPFTRALMQAVDKAAKQDVASLTQAMGSAATKKDW